MSATTLNTAGSPMAFLIVTRSPDCVVVPLKALSSQSAGLERPLVLRLSAPLIQSAEQVHRALPRPPGAERRERPPTIQARGRREQPRPRP